MPSSRLTAPPVVRSMTNWYPASVAHGLMLRYMKRRCMHTWKRSDLLDRQHCTSSAMWECATVDARYVLTIISDYSMMISVQNEVRCSYYTILIVYRVNHVIGETSNRWLSVTFPIKRWATNYPTTITVSVMSVERRAYPTILAYSNHCGFFRRAKAKTHLGKKFEVSSSTFFTNIWVYCHEF